MKPERLGRPIALLGAIMLIVHAACTKKPSPPTPGPSPEKDYGSDETALADGGRGRTLDEMGFGLPAVYFGLNEQAPTPESVDALHTLVERIPAFKACRIEGHACPIGESNYNQALSYHRAQVVLSYLRTAGVRTGFQVIAYGEERLAAVDTPSFWKNRRVEVVCR